MIYTLSLADVVYRSYKKRVICLKCLKKEDCYDLCHDNFYEKRDYRYIEAWCQLLQKKYLKCCQNKIVIAKESIRAKIDIAYNDTYDILKNMGIQAYVLKDGCQKEATVFSESVLEIRHNKDMILIDYNGVLSVEWQQLNQLAKQYNRQLTRMSIWGDQCGEIES